MEFLKEALGEELYNRVVEKLKDNENIKLANLKTGEYVSKDKFAAAQKKANEAETLAQELQSTIEKRDTDLETLKTSAGDAEKLKEQIAEMETANETAKADFSQSLKDTEKDHAIKLLIARSGPTDQNAEKSIYLLLDPEKISFEDGALTGAKEQIAQIEEASNYLFQGTKQEFSSDPPNPPTDPETDSSDWQNKFNKAKSDGDNLGMIRIKQEAFQEGVIIN